MSTENQFILHYSIHQQTTDSTTLPDHLDGFKETFGEEVFAGLESITTDAGYGSEEITNILSRAALKPM
ncbi:hypothetical protein LDL59_01240 [Kaistella anthropi]|nr:hypothetical protein [Kaistella anthropi]